MSFPRRSLTSLRISRQATPALLPTLLSTLTLSSPHLTLAALTLLSHLFSAARAADSLSANSVQETLEALIDAKPKSAEGEGGEKLMAGWVEGVGEGMVAFARCVPSSSREMPRPNSLTSLLIHKGPTPPAHLLKLPTLSPQSSPSSPRPPLPLSASPPKRLSNS